MATYVQGTQVQLALHVISATTGEDEDPQDIQLAIVAPDQTELVETLSKGQIVQDEDQDGNPIVGHYRASIDTTPAIGMYVYEAAVLGDNAVRVRRSFSVRAAIGPLEA